MLFLYNIDNDTLYGPFTAISDGGKDLEPKIWRGKYPYQVRVSTNGKLLSYRGFSNVLKRLRINWKEEVLPEKITEYLIRLLESPLEPEIPQIEVEEKPKLETTTLWDYPKQSYGKSPKGDNTYPGVTPAFVIYNMVIRYTNPGDLVLDPMAGSGTTIDVCKEEGR